MEVGGLCQEHIRGGDNAEVETCIRDSGEGVRMAVRQMKLELQKQ